MIEINRPIQFLECRNCTALINFEARVRNIIAVSPEMTASAASSGVVIDC